MNLPKFLFVGTAKAGTTSIYHYLRQHPEVSIPVKETFYFMKDVLVDNHLPYPKQRPLSDLILTRDEYLKVYADIDKGKTTGEIGTGYLYHHRESIPLIRETLGKDVRIAMILRNPVDRCYSSYQHFTKDLFEDLTFEESLRAEKERKNAGWDFMWHHLALGFYAAQVRAYQEAFEHVGVWLYDDLKQDAGATMKSIARFIGVTPMDVPTAKTYNPSGKPKSALLQKFITHENPVKMVLRPVFRTFFDKERRERIRKGIKSKNLTKSEGPSPEMKNYLRELYQDDVKTLSKLIDRDLDHWINPSGT